MKLRIPDDGIITAFGSIGCGKTTFAAKIVREALRTGRPVYADTSVCNIKGVKHLDIMQLGLVTPPPNSVVIIDEAGIGLNNRAYKAMPQHLIKWLKLSRHYRCVVYVLSQSWDDMDITVRRLSTRLLYLRKLWLFTLVRPVLKRVRIDKETEQIIDGYAFLPFWFAFFPVLLPSPFSVFYRPQYYSMFDSYSVPPTPIV